jgi:hypothetical protein
MTGQELPLARLKGLEPAQAQKMFTDPCDQLITRLSRGQLMVLSYFYRTFDHSNRATICDYVRAIRYRIQRRIARQINYMTIPLTDPFTVASC